ncbi:MAG: DUF4349 domain-containing protein [Thermoanaerobacteraceae bacterium]|nr:DUF4349 domain-containing protein [Thermoanaerobacteraceae bacterium]
MACQEYQELLSAYIDEVLTEEEQRRLEKHLEQCSDCRQELENLKETVVMLQSLDEVEPPAEFRQQLRQRLEAEQTRLTVERPSLVSRLMRSPWLPLSVAAMLVLFVVAVFGINMFVPRVGSMPKADRGGALQKAAPEMDIAEQRAEYSKAKENGIAREQELALDNKSTVPTEEKQFERKVIQRANFTVQVENVPAAEQKLRSLTGRLGGYVQSASIGKRDADHYYAHLTLRVPQEKFNAAVAEIKQLGEVINFSSGGEDVTRQYYDTEARLKVMKEEEESLLKLLEKAGKLEDIMQVRRELSRVRQEIEVMESELKRLDHLTSLATIDVSLQQQEVPDDQISTKSVGGVWSRAVQAFILSTNRLIKGLGELVVGLAALLPVLLLGIIVLVVIAIVKFTQRGNSE